MNKCRLVWIESTPYFISSRISRKYGLIPLKHFLRNLVATFDVQKGRGGGERGRDREIERDKVRGGEGDEDQPLPLLFC